MQEQTFKVGDGVYCPSTTTKICTVGEFDDVLCVSRNNKEHAPFNQHGISTITKMQFVFHATEENHKKLCDLYGVEFEAPPKRKTPKEVIRAMLDDGWEYVPCKTEICREYFSGVDTADYVLLIENGLFVCEHGTYNDVEPFDPKTNKVIIDYIDGQIITE